MKVNVEFDSYANAAPQSFRDAVLTAASVVDALFIDPVTINISVGYGELSGTVEPSGQAQGGPDSGVYNSYSQVLAWLGQNAQFDVRGAIAALPTGNSIQGETNVAVWRAQEKLTGQISPSDTGLDGHIGFATDVPANLLSIIAVHEITHAMGRLTYGPGPDVMDLFQFTAPGTRLFNVATNNTSAYFSLDNGKTVLAHYSTDPGDFVAGAVQTLHDPFDQFYDQSTLQALTQTDLLQMEVLGFHVSPASPNEINVNDLTYAGTASGANHFIDLPNFEASFPDLIAAFGTNESNMQSWYNAHENVEHRVETFDGLNYVASYVDLIAAFGSAGSLKAVQDDGAQHFITSGSAEDRITTFNGLDYIASYSDLAKAFGTNADSGAYHYIRDGFHEGRTTGFDGLNYIASYSDLIRAFGANEQAGAAHFITNGLSEGRASTFSGLSYIAQYTDLMTAFGADNNAGASHYINNGFHEGRTTSFDVAGYEQAHPDLVGQYPTAEKFLTDYINYYKSTGHFLT